MPFFGGKVGVTVDMLNPKSPATICNRLVTNHHFLKSRFIIIQKDPCFFKMVATTSSGKPFYWEKDSQFDLGIFFQYLGSEVYALCACVLLKILDSLIPQKWPLLKWNDQTTATKISMITISLSIYSMKQQIH